MEQIGDDFESIVYPTVARLFGSEWTPGVDSDPRITILHADLGGGRLLQRRRRVPGAALRRRSNEREMLYIDSENLGAPGVAYNALLHMSFSTGPLTCGRQRGFLGERGPVAGAAAGGRRRPQTGSVHFPRRTGYAAHLLAGIRVGRALRRRRALLWAICWTTTVAAIERLNCWQRWRQHHGSSRPISMGFGAKFNDVFARLGNRQLPGSRRRAVFTLLRLMRLTGRYDGQLGQASGEGDVDQFAADYLETGGRRHFCL